MQGNEILRRLIDHELDKGCYGPIGIPGFALALVFGVVSRLAAQKSRKYPQWTMPVAYALAAACIVGGFLLALISKPLLASSAAVSPTPPMRIYRIDQKADNRAAVAGVQGNVSVNKPLAENEFNRAAIYELEFNPLAALPHYETAYRYRPNNSRYGQAYANLLYAEQDFGKAEAIYKNVLAIRRELANPPAYLPDLAATLNILGILYRATQRLKESAEAFTEALQTVF